MLKDDELASADVTVPLAPCTLRKPCCALAQPGPLPGKAPAVKLRASRGSLSKEEAAICPCTGMTEMKKLPFPAKGKK